MPGHPVAGSPHEATEAAGGSDAGGRAEITQLGAGNLPR
jgi:hypothetical protein